MLRGSVRPAALGVALSAVAWGCGGELPPAATDGGDDLGGADAAEVAADAGETGADRPADVSMDVEIPAPPIVVGSVPWNASGADVGTVAALAEVGDTLFLYGSRGMQVIEGGVVAATDARVTAWRTAAVIPAGDGTAGDWVVGVDAMGRVWRLRNRDSLEEVTGRYALMMRDAQSVARLSMNRVAFGLRAGLAVADGTQVRVWMDPSFVNLVGAGSRVAAPTAAGVRVFELDATRFVDFTLAGVTGVAFDAMGKLVVTTADALYTENDRGELIFRRRSAAPLRGLVQSGARTWLVAGASLALWDGADIRPSTDVRVAAGARLIPSQGDVWVLNAGALSRYSIVESPDLQLWIETVRPVFARRCTPCHLPGETGNRDLTTYAAWVAGRADVRSRVLTVMDMPPPPGMLTAAERAAIARWINATPMDGGVADAGRPDVPADRPAEAGVDAGMDAARDVAADAPREVGVDAPREVGVDAPRDVAADAAPVTYAAVNTIFQAACVRCHGASGALNLATPATAYTALVGAAAAGGSCAGGGRVRVVAGNPMGSLLYLKLVNMQPCGNSMPRGGTLTAAQIDTVRQWIQGGALR